jgi:hypothetical protein
MPNWDEIKSGIVTYLMRDDAYNGAVERKGILTSDADIHISQNILFPIRNFILQSHEEVMDIMGYDSKCRLTTMWASRTRLGGYHEEHIHRNTFLASVFYVYDSDNIASGTVFKNTQTNLFQITPRIKKNSQELLKKSETLAFEAGTCMIFPGWTTHQTNPSESDCRIIIGANSMPIGKTNIDGNIGRCFHNYNFTDSTD